MKTISVQQASQMLGLTVGAVRGLLATGYLKGEKVDRVWNVSFESVQVLQALLRVPLRMVANLPSEKELQLIGPGLCPVCAGSNWAPAQKGSQFSSEFLECTDCSFSLHESFLEFGSSEQLREKIREHIHSLLLVVRNGEAARECLQRRAQALLAFD
ncbi:MAG: hypothetical protein U0931_22875 [Vulcanimicrobiota bacterium]